ncbi:hypothetical protein KJ765_03910 [Candidatus Micrarchaeota archaeon]|nr:hypothetical protein [Candidatus Micrarchaeota archaeon]
MAGKPRVVKVTSQKKPRVVREDDYSLMLKSEENEEERPKHVVFEGLNKQAGDAPRDKLREEALKDITPLEKGKTLEQEGEAPSLQKRVRKFMGMK